MVSMFTKHTNKKICFFSTQSRIVSAFRNDPGQNYIMEKQSETETPELHKQPGAMFILILAKIFVKNL